MPRIGSVRVDGTTLYAEVRGSGPACLIIPGGAEDAEGWRPVAERLGGHTVVTYDRRGTLRSGREDWPGRGSLQHAHDAAGLLSALGLRNALVFGGSSAGIVVVQLALLHPQLLRRALVYEPGYFACIPGGEELRRRVTAPMDRHLAAHPGDWAGSYRTFAGADGREPLLQGLLESPPGLSWYARREELNAEAFVRDDAPILTAEHVDEAALAACPSDIRFSYGSASMDVFRDIVTALAAMRGMVPDVIEGVGHSLYHHPDRAAAYIDRHA